jgi:gamma-glutamyltranspeptidase/glutathione hydrolase
MNTLDTSGSRVRLFSAAALSLLALSCSSGVPVSTGDVVADQAMVASAHPAASAAGVEILQMGGNAVDAAVATAFALALAEPNTSGLGGGGFMVIKLAGQPEPVMVNYREKAPEGATPEHYYGPEADFSDLTSHGPNASGVPGTVAGLALALERYGTMTLAQVMAPAIRLCREGIVVSPLLNGMILDNLEKLGEFPAAAAIYTPDGLPLEPGDTLRNEDLAHSMELIAAQGPSVFYEGEIGQAIVAEIQRLGGVMVMEDLNDYEAQIRTPVTGSYRGYDLISAGPPAAGGTHVIELLNIMEGYDVSGLGFGTAPYIHTLAEAQKMIFADKARNAGDPDFFDIPSGTLTSKEYAQGLRERIREGEARFDYEAPNLVARESGSTTHLSVADGAGNVVALTQSINLFFGSGVVVPGTGILMNNHMADFDSREGGPNAVGPGKRPVSNMAPTIVLKNGEPFLSVGSPGAARIISALGEIVMNLVDFRMGLDDAIEAPRVHMAGRTLAMEGRISPEVVETLESWGHTVRMYPDWDSYFGGAQGILVDVGKKKLLGAADSRRDGVAVGY